MSKTTYNAFSQFERVPPIVTRFLAIEGRDPDACWPWIGYVDQWGYGRVGVSYDGRRGSLNVHRFIYLMLVGDITPGNEIDHRCQRRDCANVDHLEEAAYVENQERSRSVTVANRNKTHCIRGHALSGDNLDTWLLREKGYRACRKCMNAWKRENTPRHPKPVRTHCDQGHALTHDNLVAWALRRGERRCLTCHRSKHAERERARRATAKKVC
jgi:hypothetical protein